MKILHCLILPICFLACTVNAQLPSRTLAPEQDRAAIEALLSTMPPSGEFAPTIAERGAHHRVWHKIKVETDPLGRITVRTNSYVELSSGLHYRAANGDWLESEAKIEIRPNGSAIAEKGQHQVIFSANANTRGGTRLLTPDHKTLRTHVVGLAYFDFKKKESVMIAEVKDSVGVLVGENQVLYRNAFTDFKADIRYTYTKGGLEQDIILRERPPLPENFGFDPRSTWMEAWTEFVDSPAPVIEQRIRKGWTKSKVDAVLDFGAMKIGNGAAFGIGGEARKHDGVPVQKHWETIGGRTFLIEEVSFRLCVPELRKLPEAARAAAPQKNNIHQISKHRLFPELQEANAKISEKIQVASLAIAQPGFVLDWAILNAQTIVLKGDTTYLVTGTVNLDNVTIEGNSVIKYTNGATIKILGTVNCLTASYRPAVFSSYLDSSVGESIASGTPAGTYADVALWLQNGGSLHNIHVRYANKGVYSSENYAVSHSQFVHCNKALQTESATFSANNVLMYDVGTAFYGKFFHGAAQHLTFNQGTLVTDDYFYQPETCEDPPSSSIALTNSLITAVTQGYGIVPVSIDHVTFLTNSVGIFQTVGGGTYLAANSPYRNAGTTNITASLLAALRTRTTYPPLVFSNVAISVDTVFSPQAQRDTDTPDLGFHPEPLDYAFGGVDANANLTFAAGTAVGWFRTSSGWYHAGHGIHIADGKRVTFDGRVDAPNYWVRCNVVQEGSTGPWQGGYGPGGISGWAWPDFSQAPQIWARFTRCSALASDMNHFRDDWGYLVVNATDCQFSSASVGGYTMAPHFTNCFFDRVHVALYGEQPENSFSMRNCLMRGGYLILSHQENPATPWTSSIRDSAFDGTSITISPPGSPPNWAPLDSDYNAFTNGANRLLPQGTNDVLVSSFNWQTGPLGNYYQGSTNLLNKGSRTSDLAGLYHYTTTTNQVKEATSQVDVGFHYVAVTNGAPGDEDGDGVSDYLEDRNGNGSVDSGETDWNSATDLGLKVRITQPKNNSTLP